MTKKKSQMIGFQNKLQTFVNDQQKEGKNQ